MNTFKVENDSSDMTQDDPLPLNADSVKVEIDETENVQDLQNVMTVKAEIDETEIGKLFVYLPNSPKPNPKFTSYLAGFLSASQTGAKSMSQSEFEFFEKLNPNLDQTGWPERICDLKSKLLL